MSLTSLPIGIFDSGVGGLTVMQQIMRLLPNERLIYLGDTARIPYGNKSCKTIVRICTENTISLLEKKIKLLVIACNTASAFALSHLKQLFNIPILGVIEPGAQKAVEVTRSNRVAVLGTKGTIESGAYQAAIRHLAPQAMILPLACPLFVPLVEEQWIEHPATVLIVQEYLRPLKNQQIDTLLLGCTHYPLLSSLIQAEVGKNIRIVDSASTCALQVQSILKDKDLLSASLDGQHQYFVTDDPEKFRSLGERLFGQQLEKVELLSSDFAFH